MMLGANKWAPARRVGTLPADFRGLLCGGRAFPCIFHGGVFSLMAKHIFVTGGVVSSLGKGLTSASIGMLLEKRGLTVRLQKLDPYINVDPGTMSPYPARGGVRVGRWE